MSDGSQIHDGNLYFRSYPNSTRPLFYAWKDGSITESFNSLSDFKNSQFFTDSKRIYPPGFENFGIEADPEIDREYRPAADNPAATGAIDLSLKEWPGVDGGIYRGALPP